MTRDPKDEYSKEGTSPVASNRVNKGLAYYRAFGNRLRITRVTLDLCEAQAASACGVALRTYRTWEAGAPDCGCLRGYPRALVAFADRYDVSLDWLVCGLGDCLGRHLAAKSAGSVAILPIKSDECRRRAAYELVGAVLARAPHPP